METAAVVREETLGPIVAEQHAATRLTRLHVIWLGIVLAMLGLVYFPTITWLVDRWTMSVWHNAHGMLIPVVVGYFIYHELKRKRNLPASSSAWGFLFFIPALAVHVLDTGMHTQLLSAASIVLILPGLSLLFLGRRRTASIAFPLAFMALMLPIPLALTESLHLVLRKIATVASSAIVPLLGITAYTEGTTVHLAGATLQVSDACSGFSTLYAACAVAALTAYSCPDWRRRILVLLGAAPVAIAANIVRVTMLIAIVDWTNADVLSTWIHPASGMMTFALALPLIFWLGTPSLKPSANGMAKAEPASPKPPAMTAAKAEPASPKPPAMTAAKAGFAPITAALLVVALIPTVIHSYRGLKVDDGLTVAAIPEILAGAPSQPTTRKARWVESTFEATDWFERTYRAGSENVRVFAARSYDPKRLYHHPELALLRGYDSVAAGLAALPGRPDVPIHLLQTSRDGRRGVAAYALLYDGKYVDSPLWFQLRTAVELLFSGRQPMTLVMASDLAGPQSRLEDAPSVHVLAAAIQAFEAAARE